MRAFGAPVVLLEHHDRGGCTRIPERKSSKRGAWDIWLLDWSLTSTGKPMTRHKDFPAALNVQFERALEAIESAHATILNERVWACCALEHLSVADVASLNDARRKWQTAVAALRAYRRQPAAAAEDENA